ncbi:mitochondrial glycoprotein [Cyathus striatus]|nr:mitochondrial glycoprotein [Cyathus striatus]
MRPIASSAARVILRPSAAVAVRAFSGSAARFGEGNKLQYEKEANATLDTTPEFLKQFMSQGFGRYIEDIPGNDEVTLTRKFGNENIRLTFSIADIQAEEEDFENEEGEESAGEDEVPGYPIRASLSVTKTTGPGALNVDMVCQEGHFIVGLTLAEMDWKRRGLYIGPQVLRDLDVGVQEEFEKFLQERGINETVALFIPEYAEHKEQQEYVKWLHKVKSFVDL